MKIISMVYLSLCIAIFAFISTSIVDAKEIRIADEIIDIGNQKSSYDILVHTDDYFWVLIKPSITSKCTDDNVIATAWIMHVATNSGLQKGIFDKEPYVANVKMILTKESFDKINHASSILKLAYINDKSDIIRLSKFEIPEWDDILPETNEEVTFNAVFAALK